MTHYSKTFRCASVAVIHFTTAVPMSAAATAEAHLNVFVFALFNPNVLYGKPTNSPRA